MKSLKRTMLLIAVLTLTFGFVQTGMAANAKVIAVKFHADWCTSCKVMAPAYEALKQQYGDSEVLFVTMDRTDDATVQQSALLASALGISDVFENNQKTGYILLLNAKNKKVMGKLTKAHTSAEMSQVIDGVLAGKNYMKGSPGKGSMKHKGSEKKSMQKGSGGHKKGSRKGSGY